MVSSRTKKIIGITLGIVFFACAITGFLIGNKGLGINLKQTHVILGILSVILAIIHIIFSKNYLAKK